MWVELGVPTGSEASKRRPCVVMSNDAANTVASQLGRGVITVVPLTSNLSHAVHSHLVLPAAQSGLSRDSAVQVEQIRAVDVSRVRSPSGRVPNALMEQVELALRVHLDLV